jgi:hypothetical protein
MLDKERELYIAHYANGALSITGKMTNRHGLIAGATGTEKTVDSLCKLNRIGKSIRLMPGQILKYN